MNRRIVVITGGNSLLGQHVIKHLQLYSTDDYDLIRVHANPGEELENRVDYEQNIPIEFHAGSPFDRNFLAELVKGAETVIHLYEVFDQSIWPDATETISHNEYATFNLLNACVLAGVESFVYKSSVWVNASTVWPSVMNPESSKPPPPAERPFPEYTASKLSAEQLLETFGDFMKCIILRCGPLYGEGDLESVVFDLLQEAVRTADRRLTKIGDGKGFLQMTYAGNVGWGMLSILSKLNEEDGVQLGKPEIVYLLDNTPIQPIYTSLQPYMTHLGLKYAEKSTSFPVLYFTVLALSKLSKLLDRDFLVSLVEEDRFRSPDFLFTHFYYWYFFSGTKARIYLDYRPLYSYEKALILSKDYYRKAFERR